jgi:hypothetical protein
MLSLPLCQIRLPNHCGPTECVQTLPRLSTKTRPVGDLHRLVYRFPDPDAGACPER